MKSFSAYKIFNNSFHLKTTIQIHPGSESTEFVLELSSLLKELGCPYSVLVSGPPSQRFQSKDVRILLLNYLVSELMAAKMIQKLNPHKKIVIEIVRYKHHF